MTIASPTPASYPPASSAGSAWSPFRHRAFALLWTATLISNIGTWMHDVGAGWLMTTLNSSPAIVALVQAATTAPIFLFALFAGALADRVDKRRFLLIVNLVLTGVTVAMATLTAAGAMTPALLLAFTFAIGTGAALMAPAWQAVAPSLVPRESLQPAIALNSMGINIARAIGPALAGFLISAVALSAPFIVNAVSYLAIVAALLLWKPETGPAKTLPPEPLFGAMATGLRHASRNSALKATLVRSFGFFTFGSAYWALLPLVARRLEGGGAEIYGVLLAAIGGGAVAGALVLPYIRKRIDANRLVAAGTLITAAAMALLGLATSAATALPASVLGGLGWITVLTSLNVSAQTALPNWVRARGLAITLMVFFGCMSAGSAGWGQVATATSVPTALLIAAAGAVFAILLTWRAKLGQGEALDLTPAMSWPEPVIAESLDAAPDRGPVLVTIRYQVDEGDTEGFLAAMHEIAGERYRDGAHDWGVYQDAAEPGAWIEWFFLPSWAEHLRQHERATKHDQDIHARAREFHLGAEPPEVSHFLAPLHSTQIVAKTKGGAR
ncbi:MFS transporter [Inquilinus sp. CAU 1745]|uniref:MFS transporter n=1 Tax=Inquilinus sp. CAU 1745 TaxID=3140369 RepID=UPI00325ABC95